MQTSDHCRKLACGKGVELKMQQRPAALRRGAWGWTHLAPERQTFQDVAAEREQRLISHMLLITGVIHDLSCKHIPCRTALERRSAAAVGRRQALTLRGRVDVADGDEAGESGHRDG